MASVTEVTFQGYDARRPRRGVKMNPHELMKKTTGTEVIAGFRGCGGDELGHSPPAKNRWAVNSGFSFNQS